MNACTASLQSTAPTCWTAAIAAGRRSDCVPPPRQRAFGVHCNGKPCRTRSITTARYPVDLGERPISKDCTLSSSTTDPVSTSNEDPSGKRQAFLAILDDVIDEYRTDKNIIFRDDRERSKYLFSHLDDVDRTWKRSARCMVPACTKKSIARSHAVPRGMLLERVGEAGHVLTPARDRGDGGRLVLQRVGLSIASTFPGFCDSHELLFQSFENAKKVAGERDVLLQAYRTACRELFRTKFWVDKTTKLLKEFEDLRDRRLAERLRERLVAASVTAGEVLNFQIKDDPLLTSWDRQLANLRKLCLYLESKLVPALEAAVFSSEESGLHVWAVDIDIELPVGLSGATTIPLTGSGEDALLHLVMAVLPHTGGSLVCIVGTSEDQVDLTSYKDRWMQNALEFLSMVESWMINGTDQWYLRPSVWNQIGAQRQNLILEEIEACSRSVNQEAGQAIFDDLRRTVLAAFEAEHVGRSDEMYLDFVKKHRAKCGTS